MLPFDLSWKFKAVICVDVGAIDVDSSLWVMKEEVIVETWKEDLGYTFLFNFIVQVFKVFFDFLYVGFFGESERDIFLTVVYVGPPMSFHFFFA